MRTGYRNTFNFQKVVMELYEEYIIEISCTPDKDI